MLPNLELKGTVQYHDNKGGFVSSNSRYTVEYSAMYSLYLQDVSVNLPDLCYKSYENSCAFCNVFFM